MSFPASTSVARFCTRSPVLLITLSVTWKSRLPSSWRTPKRGPLEWWASQFKHTYPVFTAWGYLCDSPMCFPSFLLQVRCMFTVEQSWCVQTCVSGLGLVWWIGNLPDYPHMQINRKKNDGNSSDCWSAYFILNSYHVYLIYLLCCCFREQSTAWPRPFPTDH